MKEILEKLDSHQEWRDSSGERGEQLVLENEQLCGVDLSGRQLSQSVLQAVDFSNAKLDRACFNDVAATRCNFSSCSAVDTFFGGVFTRCDFSQSNLRGALLPDQCEGSDFSLAILAGANFSKKTFHSCNFEAASIVGASVTKSNFSRCDFSKASFSRANLVKAMFSDCRFSRTDFDEATLRAVHIEGEGFDSVTGVPMYILDLSFLADHSQGSNKIFPNTPRYRTIDSLNGSIDDLLLGSDDICPQSGFWVSDDDDFEEILVIQGETFPKRSGAATDWLLEKAIAET